jgi:adenylate cyclase
VAHHALGVSLLIVGEFVQGLDHIEQGAAIYDPRQHAALTFVSGQDSGVACLSYRAWSLWFLGYPDQARKCIREALSLAHRVSHALSTVAATIIAAWVYQLLRDQPAASEQVEEAVSLSTEYNFQFWRAIGVIGQGWAMTEQGLVDDGIARLSAGLTAFRSIGGQILMPYFLGLMAQAYARAGHVEEGLSSLAEAENAVAESGESWWGAELCRLKGELILKRSVVESDQQTETEAEEYFSRALAIAGQKNARSLELRAAMSLARLLAKQNRRAEARAMLADIYNWFTEGFGTADLIDAKALLDELAG